MAIRRVHQGRAQSPVLCGYFGGAMTCVCAVVDTSPSRWVDLPLRIESVANKREHWSKRARRTKLHRLAALAVPVSPLPCVVTLVRVAPRALDSDNLQSGFKALRDGIADRLGVKDHDP